MKCAHSHLVIKINLRKMCKFLIYSVGTVTGILVIFRKLIFLFFTSFSVIYVRKKYKKIFHEILRKALSKMSVSEFT